MIKDNYLLISSYNPHLMIKIFFAGALALFGILISWSGSYFIPVFGILNCTNWAGYLDTDCDQLADSWETSGYNGLNLRAMGADPNVKDVFLEIDYISHHKPRSGVVEAVTTAFANSLVANVAGHPTGIRLHVSVGEDIGQKTGDPCTNGWTDFNTIKNSWFGTASERGNPTLLAAKRNTFHYGLFIHTQCANLPASGTSEIFGNDLMVSLGYPGWGTDSSGNIVGSIPEQEGTLMHELGHNLNLRHGGNVDVNCKPNYLSVMNWAFQFPIYTINPNFPDYSKWLWTSLSESDLSEPAGVGIAGYQTAIGGGISPHPLIKPFVPTGSPVDYNDNGATTDLHVVRNLNNFGYTGTVSDSNCNSNTFTTLFGYKDWGDLLKYWGVGGEYSNGTFINQASVKQNKQGYTNIALQSNSNQTDDGVGNFTHTDVTIDFVKSARLQILQGINSEIQSIPDKAFVNPGLANDTRTQFEEDLMSGNSSIANLSQSNKLGPAIEALATLREKMDSSFGGSAKDDLIVDPKAQGVIVRLIDNFTEVLVQQR